MKKLFTFLLSVSAVMLVQAQTKNPTQNDPDAKQILDAVSARFRTFKSPQASFTYTVENAQGKPLSTKKGTVSMRGNKYRVSMPGLEIFSDGRTAWSYDKNANEVTIDNVNASGSAMTPQKLFTNFYDKDFLYKLNGEKTVAGKNIQEIEMTPTDKSRPFHKVYVWIDKMAKTIYSAKFLEKNGNRYSYTVNSLNPNASLSDASFVFDKNKFPGVEVVDLR
ncbi:MAG: outer membrane lipoprotein carrier protein LolA [Bacteroidota bacterium]|nr:outer membrane lipoprotein carrier protein LolA [Flavisolibacter sp.]MBD0352873.1 outer membrane lipoprotein carrier protein LolA [Flavisolibacter sp.]MDQ3846223.1 outer membrane lipoprotein carrier protein LolA [Bacteroidota bacterium]